MIGTGELLLILCVALLLFGGKRLPELAKSLGEGIRIFKDTVEGKETNSSQKKSESSIEDDADKP